MRRPFEHHTFIASRADLLRGWSEVAPGAPSRPLPALGAAGARWNRRR